MDEPYPRQALFWLVADGGGKTRLIDSQEREVPCHLDGSLPDRGAADVTLTAAGVVRRVTVVRHPQFDRVFAVVDPASSPGGSAIALETLVNQIAHDIRNSAFTIGLQAEMGLRGSPTPEGRRHLEAVLRQIDGLKAYLDKLLLFGRPAAVAAQSFAVESFLREEIERFQFSRAPSDPPLSIRIDLADVGGTVTWDRRAMGTVLAALLDNAARSASPPPPIVVTAGPANGKVVIAVRDAGPGMTPENLAAVATPMKVRRAGAAGLGLAIARKLLRAHGGELELCSGPDGTTATIVLPPEVGTD